MARIPSFINVKLNKKGKLLVRRHRVPLMDVKIVWTDGAGTPIEVGNGKTPVLSHRFYLEKGSLPAGIDPMLVKRVILPKLDYSSPDMLWVTIETYVEA